MNLQQDIAFIDSAADSKNRIYYHPFYKERLKRVNVYEIENHSFDDYKAIVIPNNIDEEYLYRNKNILEKFLADGKILVSFATNFKTWIPGDVTYKASPTRIVERDIIADTNHLIFNGVTQYDINYRRGVKGFFSRGYYDAPSGSEIIAEDNEGKAVIYIDRKTTNGTILVGAGTDLLGFGTMDTNTSRRIGRQFIQWIDEEERRNQA